MTAAGEQNMDMSNWESGETDAHPMRAMSIGGTTEIAGETRPKPDLQEAQRRLDTLSQTIETEVIPRLIQARRAAALLTIAPPGMPLVPVAVAPWAPSQHEVAELARLCIVRDDSLAVIYLTKLYEAGARLETIYTGLLGPAARHLGDLWDDDRISFSEVTTGVWRLQQMLTALTPAFQAEVHWRDQGRRILLLPAIGEQHSFGMMMVSAFFQRDGWNVRSELFASNAELVDLLRAEWFDVVGFSVGDGTKLDALRTSITSARGASRNLHLGVMVGGPAFIEHPEFVGAVGADATAADGSTAASEAERLLKLLARTG